MKSLGKILEEYNETKKQIYNYFGYVEDWVVIPIEDRTNYLWDFGEDDVVFAKNKNDFETGNYYQDEIYKQRFLNKWVYEKDGYTMICVDTHTDGNKFLAIYDNSKRVNGLIDDLL